MEYVIKTFDNEIIEITADEFQNIVGKNGMVYIPSKGEFINTSTIKRIIPRSTYLVDKMLDRADQREGVLHDGTRVVKYFGQWFGAGDVDEHGRPYRVVPLDNYPEAAKDCIPTPEEYYREYAHLSRPERLKKILLDNNKVRSEVVSLKEGLDDTWKKIENLHN